MDRNVDFRGLVTFFGPQVPLAYGGVVCRLGLFSTEEDVDGKATVDMQVFITLGGGIECLQFYCFGGDQRPFRALGGVPILIVSLSSHVYSSAEVFSFLFVLECVCLGHFLCRSLWGFSCIGITCGI